MKILAIVLVVMGMFLGEAVTAQQAAPASLEGTVVQFGTDNVLRGATVDLRTDSGRSVGVTTDADGKFVFPNVQPGHYRLQAGYPGFVRAEYGLRADVASSKGIPVGFYGLTGAIENWRRSRASSPGLTVEAGQKRTGLRIVMTPGGVITGRVIDQGEPVAGLIVSAVKVSYESGGQTVLSQFLSGATNDLGEYHVFWLPPGLYYVMADPNDVRRIPPPSMFINPTDGAENPLFSRGPGWIQLGRPFVPREGILFVKSARLSDTEMHVSKFFPDKADWHDATLIQIGPGEEVRNVDILADPVPALHIRGTVEGVPPLLNARGGPIRTQLALFAAGSPASGSISGTAFASTTADPNGTFDFPRIPPGSYLLRAAAGNLVSRALVEVRNRDVNVTVTPASGLSMSGKVVAEADVNMGGLTVGLRLQSTDAPVTTARPAADGSFTIQGILPNQDYQAFVTPILPPLGNQPALTPPALQNLYVKSIALGGTQTDVLNTGLRLTTQAAQQLVITIGSNSGVVEGRVVSGREPVSAATVVLIPESDQRFHVNHKFALADEDGRFQISRVPPGDYKLFAWELIEPFAWQNADYVKTYESRGRPVHVNEGGKVTIDVTSIR